MKTQLILMITAVLLLLGITACADQTTPGLAVEAPTLVMFYTDT